VKAHESEKCQAQREKNKDVKPKDVKHKDNVIDFFLRIREALNG